MGVCLSCCGLSGANDDDDLRRQHSERAPLLQDPSAVLPPTRIEPNPEDEQREQEALARIVKKTSESLIDIQSTLDRRPGNDMNPDQRLAHFEYLYERLLNTGTDQVSNDIEDSGSRHVPLEVDDAPLDVPKLKPVGDIIVKLTWD